MSDIVTGIISVDGHAVGGADVLVFGPGERPPLLASGTTNADGSFALTAADGAGGPLAVLARLKREVIGVAAREVAKAGPVAIDLFGPAYTLTVSVTSFVGRPESLTIALEPADPIEVSERLRPFINQRGPGVFASRFATLELRGDTLAVRVLPGTWRISGEFLVADRSNIREPDFRNYIVTSARSEPDGAPLPGSETTGFALEINRDRTVTVMLREVSDAEL